MATVDQLRVQPSDPMERLMMQIRSLERRIEFLEALIQRIPTQAAAPTAAAQEGSMVVDLSSNRLYVRVNGFWRWVALT